MKIKGTKIITTLLTAVMLIEQITAAAPVHYVYAEGESENVNNDSETDSGNETSVPEGGMYSGDGYSVEVVVSDSWEGAYNVKLQISNTSEETIHNWGIIMKTSDMISGLYNAVELSEKDGMHLLKNAGYNQDIPAGGSVEAGYTAFYEGDFDVPKEFALSHIEKEVDMTECEVSLFITDEWEDGGMAQISIENTSDSVIEDWSLEFDSIMDIVNLWGGVIESHEGEHYFIRNADYAQNIAAGETLAVEIVFNGNAADILNVKVSQIVVCDTGMESEVTPTPTPIADEEDTDYETDTDGDGIPDAYEEMIGTDLALTDTDSDRLDDYAEVFVLGSDPLVYDSIESGVADGDADSDGDGISNLQEINMGINPSLKDTDYDGLDDNEEIDIYGTDPADSDTDDDGLKDGDEVKLGLDPNNSSTYGISDAEYPVQQTIESDSSVFEKINTVDNPYLISADIKAAGYLEEILDVSKSAFSALIENDAMFGMPIQLHYEYEETVEKATIYFEIEDKYIVGDNMFYPDVEELRGIHRYNVFHYFEDRNMLLPVETFFDEEKNIVYTETDELGTYCLMDMEKVFDRLNSATEMQTGSDENIGRYAPDLSEQTDINDIQMTALELSQDISGITSNTISVDDDIPVTKTVPEGDGRQLVNLYFILFRAGESDWIYEKERDLIPEVLEKLQENNNDYRFRAIVLFHDKCWDYYHAGLLKWYEDPDELKDMLMEMDYYSHYNGYVDYDDAGSILRGLLREQIKDNPDSLNFAYNCTSTHMWCSRHISRPYSIYEDFVGKVVYSDIGKYLFQYEDYDETSEYPTFVEKTGGKRWICEGDMVSKVYEHITGILPEVSEGGEGGDMPVPSGGDGEGNGEDEPKDPPEDQEEQKTPYIILLLTEWNIIGLNAPIEVEGLTDTDQDGLTDWEEVDQSEITYDFLGNIKLPRLKECIEDKSLDRFKESMYPLYEKMMDTYVLPITSNPAKKDSDGDDIQDIDDPEPLSHFGRYINNHIDFRVSNSAKVPYNSAIENAKGITWLDYKKLWETRAGNTIDNDDLETIYILNIVARAKMMLGAAYLLNDVLFLADALVGKRVDIDDGCYFLAYYLSSLGGYVEYDGTYPAVVDKNGLSKYEYYVDELLNVCERGTKAGCKLTFTQIDAACGDTPITYSADDFSTLNYWLAIKGGHIGMSGECTYDGEYYNLNLTYSIQDYYDFYYDNPDDGEDSVGLVNNNEMAYLVYWFEAEPFDNCGVYKVDIRWKKGQSLADATQIPLDYSYVGR